MAAGTCGSVLTHIVHVFIGEEILKSPSTDTVNRCIVEPTLCCKYEIAEWMACSSDHILAFDGTKND